MGHRAQRPNWQSEQARIVEGPSRKPVFLVAGLFLAAVAGAVLTTGPASGPAHPSRSGPPIVVARVTHPAAHPQGRVTSRSHPADPGRWL
ncbi:MAG: hypothetical protein ABSH30_02530 [Acidimicrobiales bacterium]|jgi:hypothetical protein